MSTKFNLRILMLSLDKTLLAGGGDTKIRLVDYSQHLELLEVIVPTPRNEKREIKENIFVTGVGGPKPLQIFRILKLGYKLIRLQKINLIITNDPNLGFLGWLLKIITGVKLNVNVFGLEIADKRWLAERFITNRLIRLLQLFVLQRADSIRSDSRFAIGELRKFGMARKKIIFIPVIPSSMMIERLKRLGGQRPQRKGKTIRLLAVASLIPQKGIDILIKAFSQVRETNQDARLVIVGDGPEKQRLRVMVDSLGLKKKVKFVGAVDYNKLPKYYLASDILVVSSWYEGGPRVVMEAAFCRLVIVSTRVGSVQDMLTVGKSIEIVASGDVATLADKINQFVQDENKRKSFGKKARQEIEKYCDYKKNRQQLLSLWQETLS